MNDVVIPNNSPHQFESKQVRHSHSRRKISFTKKSTFRFTPQLLAVSAASLVVIAVVLVLVFRKPSTPPDPSPSPSSTLAPVAKDENDEYLEHIDELLESGNFETARDWLSYVELTSLNNCQLAEYYRLSAELVSDDLEFSVSRDYNLNYQVYSDLCKETRP